jgi:hypothetical protein
MLCQSGNSADSRSKRATANEIRLEVKVSSYPERRMGGRSSEGRKEIERRRDRQTANTNTQHNTAADVREFDAHCNFVEELLDAQVLGHSLLRLFFAVLCRCGRGRGRRGGRGGRRGSCGLFCLFGVDGRQRIVGTEQRSGGCGQATDRRVRFAGGCQQLFAGFAVRCIRERRAHEVRNATLKHSTSQRRD